MASKGPVAVASYIRARKPARFSTLLPFLYQTRTLDQPWPGKVEQRQLQFHGKHHVRALATVSTRSASDHDIPFEGASKYKDRREWQRPRYAVDGPGEDGQDLNEPRSRDSTITSSEHAVFTRIFDNLIKASANRSGDPEDSAFIGDEEQEDADSDEDLTSIFRSAVDASKLKAEKKARKKSYQSVEEHQKFYISRYPAPLRDAAAKASGILARQGSRARTAKSTVSRESRNGERKEVFQRLVQRERLLELLRVEALLKDAKTDFELWGVLEREVFSMIKTIDAHASWKPPKAKRGRTKKVIEVTQPEALSDSAPASVAVDVAPKMDVVPPLAIVGTNYPSHCLLALRLLRSQFPTSPLALCILPAIRRLGPTSYVLGASTALYNELLAIYWYVHGDMRAMANLLMEMQEQGVEFDEHTESVLEQPGWEREAVRSGERHASMSALWEMEEMKGAFSRLTAMRRVVGKTLRESEWERNSGGLRYRTFKLDSVS